jgi:hypothetical protein
VSFGIANFQQQALAPAVTSGLGGAVPKPNPVGVQLNGVFEGFGALVFPSQNTWADPFCYGTAFSGSQARTIIADNVGAVLTPTRVPISSTPSGAPASATYALQMSNPAVFDGVCEFDVLSSSVLPLPPEIGAAFAAGDNVYSPVNFWGASSAGATGNEATLGPLIVGYGTNGGFVGRFPPLGQNANFFTLPQTWGNFVQTFNWAIYGTPSNYSFLASSAFVQLGFTAFFEAYNAFDSWITSVYLGFPTLAPATGLYVTLGPGTFIMGGAAQPYSGAIYTVPSNSSGSIRYDRLVWNYLTGQVLYLEGTPGDYPPALGVGLAPLWLITVPSGASSLTPSDLTDQRERPGFYIDDQGNAVVSGATVILRQVSGPSGTADVTEDAAVETLLTTTAATAVATATPQNEGLYPVQVYFRVSTAATTVTVTITYTSPTGAQTLTLVDAVTEPVGDYSLPAQPVLSVAGQPITVNVTAGTANQVHASAAIQGV